MYIDAYVEDITIYLRLEFAKWNSFQEQVHVSGKVIKKGNDKYKIQD